MNSFLDRLPLRVAALAGLLVGVVGLAGRVDLWVCLLRVGGAFVLFWILGMALRAILMPNWPSADDDQKGALLDQTTPEMSPGDLDDSDDEPGANSERP